MRLADGLRFALRSLATQRTRTWLTLLAMGLGILYQTRPLQVARWLVGAYAAGAIGLALAQALRGGT